MLNSTPFAPPFPPLPGIFQGKVLTRGGRTWYKEGVIAPVVERFALQQGNEEAVKDIVASLHR